MASHSSLDQKRGGGIGKQQQLQSAEEYEQSDERHYEEGEPKNVDDELADSQQTVVRRSKGKKARFHNELEDEFMGSRSEPDDAVPAQDKQKVFGMETDDAEATIELSEKHRQPKVNSVAGVPYKNHLAQHEHADFPDDVHEQNDVGIGEQQESSARRVQKSETDNEDDENEFVSLDDLKADENLENIAEQLEYKGGKLTQKKTADRQTHGVEVSKDKQLKPADEMEEVDIHEGEQDHKSKGYGAAGSDRQIVFPASHLRSHNIPPVHRIVPQSPASSMSDLLATKRSHNAVEEMDAVELQEESESNQAYYLIHSGQASKVNQVVHVNTLPDYIPMDYYIFSSNRCVHFPCLMFTRHT